MCHLSHMTTVQVGFCLATEDALEGRKCVRYEPVLCCLLGLQS
jgi:hypothetical protein